MYLIIYKNLPQPYFSARGTVTQLTVGIYTSYDLPDLASSLAPAKLLIAGVTDANGQDDNLKEINTDLEVIKNAYIRNDAVNQVVIQKPELIKSPKNLFSEWMK